MSVPTNRLVPLRMRIQTTENELNEIIINLPCSLFIGLLEIRFSYANRKPVSNTISTNEIKYITKSVESTRLTSMRS